MKKFDPTKYYYFDKDLTIEQVESFTDKHLPTHKYFYQTGVDYYLTYNYDSKEGYGAVSISKFGIAFLQIHNAVKVDKTFFEEEKEEESKKNIFLKTLSSKMKKFEKLSGNTYFCKLKNNHYRNVTFSHMEKDGGVDLKYIDWSTGHNLLVISGAGAKIVAKRVLKKEPLAKIVTLEEFSKQ